MKTKKVQLNFTLRSDTVGNFDDPSQQDIEHAFHPQGVIPEYHDIIKLIKSDGDYLAAKFFTKEGRCQVAHKHDDMQLDGVELFTIDGAVKVFKRYLQNDISWTRDYHWKKGLGQLLKDRFSSHN